MLKQVQHDTVRGLLGRGSITAGPIRSLQDDKERELWVGRRPYACKQNSLLVWNDINF